jgi:hypothetical protein
MGQLDGTRIKNAILGLFSKLDSTDEEILNQNVHRRKVGVHVTDGGTAGTAQTATAFWTNDTGVTQRVIATKCITPVTAAANDTNFATVTLDKVDSAGSNAATIATSPTTIAGGAQTAFVPKTLTPTVANVLVPAGWTLRIAVSKTASGVAIAAATSQAYVEVTLEPS